MTIPAEDLVPIVIGLGVFLFVVAIGWRSVRYASFRHDERSRLARRSDADALYK